MFVWVMVGGLIDAAQQLEAAGSALVNRPAAARTTENAVGTKQQQQVSTPLTSKRIRAAIDLILLLPVLNNMFGIAWAAVRLMASMVLQCFSFKPKKRSSDLPVTSADAAVSSSKTSSGNSSWQLCLPQLLHMLHTDRALAAAIKLWLSMSILLTVTLLIADPEAGHVVWPVVSEAVSASPAAGVIAFVLAWHERVESTSIRVSSSG